ncbi:MAG: response regulator transcription factor [Clostridiales bacterium]|nr:response regulator transcription factor [Clostridiales bacterium]
MVVEDQAMPRQLFEMLVDSSEYYELAVSIDNATTADIYCLNQQIDLVLMDVVTRQGNSGLDAAARIKKKHPKIKIIIVTSMPECSWIDRARAIGVESFWYKNASTESILSVMDRTMAGESVYPDAPLAQPLGLAVSTDFTARELEVLREMTGGYTNPEIAKHLYISVASVKTHIQNMLDKTGFRNRTELAVKARECGVVILDSKK